MLATEYGFGTSTVSDIKQAKDTLGNFAATQECASPLGKRKTMRTCNDVPLDKELYTWFM